MTDVFWAGLTLTVLVGPRLAWGWLRDRRRAAEALPAHPAARAISVKRVPGRPVDGRPLSPGEWDSFVGCLWASNTTIPDVDYGQGAGR